MMNHEQPIQRSRVIALVALLALIAGCARTDLGPTGEFAPATVAVNLEFAASLNAQGGARTAYEKADRLDLRFSDSQATREQSQSNFDGTNPETRVSMIVTLHDVTETLNFSLELRRGNDALFRGSKAVALKAGRTTTITVTLEPVVAGVIAPDSVGTLTVYGQSLQLSAVAIFATGDTIDGAPVKWSSLDAGVASIDSAGLLVARSDGLARLVVRALDYADTTTARVLANVYSITVSPGGASIPIGSNAQYSAVMFDRNGNPIPTRPVVWSSTDPSVITVDPDGQAHGVGIGSARIVATVGAAAGNALANGVAAPPLTDSLKAVIIAPGVVVLSANVTANGATTTAWFEWGSPALTPAPSLTLKQFVGAALKPFPVSSRLQGLLPNTQYVARINASNSAGSTRSDSIIFIIPAVGPNVQTRDTANYLPGQITLRGAVNPNGAVVDAWFQLSTDPSFATYDSVDVGSFTGFTSTDVAAMVAVGPPGTTYWYRLRGRSTSGLVSGATFTFTVPTFGSPGLSVETRDTSNSMPGEITLNGTVHPNGVSANAWFQISLDPTFATYDSLDVGTFTGFVPVDVSANATIGPPGTTYSFRLVGSSSAGIVVGATVTFTVPGVVPPTLPPTAITDPPTVIGPGTATFMGQVNPNGLPTEVWFEWGTSMDPTTFKQTQVQQVGGGTSVLTITELVANLPQDPTIYYRIVTRNSAGTTYGDLVSFKF
jgi:Bacterial Ig-like domain (group 2)